MQRFHHFIKLFKFPVLTRRFIKLIPETINGDIKFLGKLGHLINQCTDVCCLMGILNLRNEFVNIDTISVLFIKIFKKNFKFRGGQVTKPFYHTTPILKFYFIIIIIVILFQFLIKIGSLIHSFSSDCRLFNYPLFF